MPPGLVPLAVAAIGAFALALGGVALLNGRWAGAAIAAGGVALVLWSRRVRR
jgi:hypothetical protein